MAKNAALDIRAVSKTFGKVAAVKDLTLAVRPGEIYGLIGPNGSGKTTTIKMIAGIYRSTSGVIKVRGVDVRESPTKAKRMIGYVPDDPAAYDLLTGREFLRFVGELFAMERRVRDAKIAELLSHYRLEGLADGLFTHYSRGTKQKFSIMAALLHDPELLLIDEPMVGLDPESAGTTKRLLKNFVQRGGAVLLSTHTLPIAQEICARIGLLAGGSLKAEGTPEELERRAGGVTLEDAYLKLASAV